ncbi:KIN17-like protein [Bienertia sinuspersici]
MLLFGKNSERIVDGFSEQFESAFLDHMKRSHRFSRIATTVVYNEYITDRHHVHMNSTKWISLTEFVNHLGETGKCKVEETPKGLFITYIDRDSETLFKDRRKRKRIRARLVEDEKKEQEIMKQIERAEQLMPVVENAQLSEKRTEDEELEPGKVTFALGGGLSKVGELGNRKAKEGSRVIFDDVEVEEGQKEKRAKNGDVKGNATIVGKSNLEELMEEDKKAKQRHNRKDYWLCEGIAVKVMSRKLADKGYFKKKGVVKKVINKYVGEIEMLDTKHVLRVDQAELETVIPRIGGLVKILNGAYRGSLARLISIDVNRFFAKVQIEKGAYDGRVVQDVEYEDLSKLA